MPMKTTICKSCASNNLRELRSEICVHMPVFEGLNKDPFFVFPKLIVCAKCGFSEFVFPEAHLGSVRGCTEHDVLIPL